MALNDISTTDAHYSSSLPVDELSPSIPLEILIGNAQAVPTA